MARGGRRIGAGRKPGSAASRPDGPAGVQRLRTESRRRLAEIIGTADDPLQVCIEIIRDPETPRELQAQVALGLLPYVHPKLSASAVDVVKHHAAPLNAGPALERLMAAIDNLTPQPPQPPPVTPVMTIEAEPIHAEPAPALRPIRSIRPI